MSLCAVGGYGRGEMAPQSDVDLLFLIADKQGSSYTEQITQYMLYMLWDLGLEPNVKEGKGGLRDLQTLYWIARFLDKEGKINDAQEAQSYVEMGLFDEVAATRFVRAADFLWRARIWLHYISGRPTESLSFDKQTVLARKMGYASGPIEVAVEKFMREYFTNAKEVGALTRIACAKLEAEKAILLP